MPSKTAVPYLTTCETTWICASSQLMNFPLCQIFSVFFRHIRLLRGRVLRPGRWCRTRFGFHATSLGIIAHEIFGTGNAGWCRPATRAIQFGSSFARRAREQALRSAPSAFRILKLVATNSSVLRRRCGVLIDHLELVIDFLQQVAARDFPASQQEEWDQCGYGP